MTLIRLDGFEANLRFKVALMIIFDCCIKPIVGFQVSLLVENSLFYQNYGLKRADNWLKSKGFEP
jgi:hypothetical protein